jgi:hypothetical protein
MRTSKDKRVIGHWLTLFNRLTGSSFRVTEWPDEDSSKQNIDARCVDDAGRVMALEHTLLEPFENEKADAARFLQTLAPLENDPVLLQQGVTCLVSQKVGAIPNGINWASVPGHLRSELARILPSLPDGRTLVPLKLGDMEIELSVQKMRSAPDKPGHFFTARRYPGDPGPGLILNALQRKIPKLAAAPADMRILLLEKDAVAGTIESQYEQVMNDESVQTLVGTIDAIWAVITAALERENVIFTNPIHPCEDDDRSFCSLKVNTGEFWQVHR